MSGQHNGCRIVPRKIFSCSEPLRSCSLHSLHSLRSFVSFVSRSSPRCSFFAVAHSSLPLIHHTSLSLSYSPRFFLRVIERKKKHESRSGYVYMCVRVRLYTCVCVCACMCVRRHKKNTVLIHDVFSHCGFINPPVIFPNNITVISS